MLCRFWSLFNRKHNINGKQPNIYYFWALVLYWILGTEVFMLKWKKLEITLYDSGMYILPFTKNRIVV